MTDLFLSPVGDDWINKLTEEQIRVLLERGEIDPERVAEHVSKQTRMYQDQYRSIRRDEDGNPIFPPRDL